MKCSTLFIVLVLSALVLLATGRRSYNGYKLAKMKFETQKAFEHFKFLIGDHSLDIWSYDGVCIPKVECDILLAPRHLELLITYLNLPLHLFESSRDMVSSVSTTMHIAHDNVEELIIEEEKAQQAANDNDFFSKYRTFEEITQFLLDLHAKYPAITSVFNPIVTWENRTVLGLKITVGNNASKPILVFNGLQHAREWIGGMVNAYAMKTLLEKYTSGDERIVSLLNKIDIFITPCINADGYSYTFTGDRLWRKNRRNNGDGTYGVDLNRNYELGWGIGASKSTSSIVYQGPNPLSEKESSQYVKFLESYKPRIKAGIDFHSYSQLVLRAWGFNQTLTPTEVDQREIGAAMQAAIYDTHQLKYQNLRGVELYPAGGGLDDHMYGALGFYSYTIELRDTGRYGFILPANQIIPCSEENFNAIVTLAEKHVAKYA